MHICSPIIRQILNIFGLLRIIWLNKIRHIPRE